MSDAELTRLAAEKVMGWEVSPPGDQLLAAKEPSGRWRYLGKQEFSSNQTWDPIDLIEHAWMLHERSCKLIYSRRHQYFSFLQAHVEADQETLVAWPDVLIFLTPRIITSSAVQVHSDIPAVRAANAEGAR